MRSRPGRTIAGITTSGALIIALACCGEKTGDASAAEKGAAQQQQKSTPESLKALLGQIRAAQRKGDTATAARLTKGLIPDEPRAKKALKEGLDAKRLGAIMKMHKLFTKAPDRLAARIIRSREKQSQILVHGATTEEIAANKPGTVVFKEFPGGAVKLAKTVLRPGVTFYEAEFVEPGKSRGMKYHLFFWDGSRWTMLGPVWRSLR